MRIGLQLFFSYILAAILICSFIFTILFEEIKPTIQNITQMMLSDVSLVLTKVIETEIESEMLTSDLNATQTMHQLNMESYYRHIFDQNAIIRLDVFDNSNQLVYSSHEMPIDNDIEVLLLEQDYNLIAVKNNIINQGEQIGTIVISKSIDSIIALATYLKHKVVLYGLVLILVLFLVSGFFIYLINRSLMRLIRYSKALADDNKEDTKLERPKFLAPELRQLGLALEEMKEKLEGKKYIESYIHTLTHELKSPLSSIIAAADIMQANLDQIELPEQQKMTQLRYLTNIENQSTRMHQMIERMLQLARLDSRSGVSFECSSIDLIIKEAIENTADEAKNKGIMLYATHIDPQTSCLDKFLFKQALINIISNALDFTSKNGEITISGSVVKDEYMIEIQDSGTGIPDYAIEKVLNKFYSLARPNKGKSSGLGLSFVQEVAKLHQGKVMIKNRTDGQSGVIVTFILKIITTLPKE